MIGLAALVAMAGTSFAGDKDAKAKKRTGDTAGKPIVSKVAQPDKARAYTGSHIPRKIVKNGEITDGFSQLRIIDEESIRRAGATSVAGVLNSRGAH